MNDNHFQNVDSNDKRTRRQSVYKKTLTPLKSSISSWQERWFWSTNAKDIGTCAAWALSRALITIRYVISNNIGILLTRIYLLYDIGSWRANNSHDAVADVECKFGSGRPRSNKFVKRAACNGYVKKLDTCGSPWVGPYVTSRISRMISNFKANSGGSDGISSLEAEGHSNEESNKVTHVQEPKTGKAVSININRIMIDKNSTDNEPSDLSASTRKRGQSSRSSPRPKILIPSVTKESSVKSSARKQGSRSKADGPTLRMFVLSRLEQYKSRDGRYNGIIRILADVGFLQFCYLLIKGKPGNMSYGLTKETLDGLTFEWFEKVAKELLSGSFKFTPWARRVIIPKAGKKEGRPLGQVGSPREKIVQKGLQIILETIYEPKFLDCSHGFRPGRSTHSALKLLYLKAHQMTWVIQGDISKCFDKIPHKKIISLLENDIKCSRTLDTISKALVVGFVEKNNSRVYTSNVGTPQGSVLSPLLANIVLHELDKFVTETIIPKHNRGNRRRQNPEYNKWAHIRHTKKNVTTEEQVEALEKMRKLPRMDSRDPNYRRSMYIRYADDFVYLLEGPIAEAKQIKEDIKTFLRENTGLELNDEKTVISLIRDGFYFLGASINSLRHVGFRMKTRSVLGKDISMRANVRARLNMPTQKLIEKLIKAGFAKKSHTGLVLAIPQTKLVNLDHATIIQFYNSKIHGLLNYFSFAANRIEIKNLIWILRQSAAKTLARKFKLRSMRQAFKKFGPLLEDPNTNMVIFTKSLPTIHQYNCKENINNPISSIKETWY